MSISKSPEEFQRELFGLTSRLLPVDGQRFNIYVPNLHLHQEVSTGGKVHEMTEDYVANYWALDPMHPSNFEETDTVVVTNSMLMTDHSWQKTEIFKKFFQPHGYFHNADVFFRQKERIIAVLTLIRKGPADRFTDHEVELLKRVQPFIQYTLGKVYLPKRVHNRQSMSDKFGLTVRELDVVELALTGASNKVLVNKLNISLPTLRTHLQNIYSKVGVHSNSELISNLLGILK
jgi:DNA-binding CsgD family transcriptional regulator